MYHGPTLRCLASTNSVLVAVAVCFAMPRLWLDTGTVAVTIGEQREIVDLHNRMRREAGSSNMQILTWSQSLSIAALNWSKRCDWKRGIAINSSSLADLGVGQNLYASRPPPINLTTAVLFWFKQKDSYIYANNTCAAGKFCLNYMQIVWAKSRQIGCSYTTCSTLTTLGWTDAVFLVCNYSPLGNEKVPYLSGSPCSKCSNGQFYCNNGLCDDSCNTPNTACACSAGCKNCATVTSDCRCRCTSGWTGVDCSECIDIDSRCHLEWSQELCVSTRPHVINGCPKMCGLCQAAAAATTNVSCSSPKFTSSLTTGIPTSKVTSAQTRSVTSTAAETTTILSRRTTAKEFITISALSSSGDPEATTDGWSTPEMSSVVQQRQTSASSSSNAGTTSSGSAADDDSLQRDTCLITVNYQVELRRQPSSNASTFQVVGAGISFVYLGARRGPINGTMWLTVAAMPGAYPIAWIDERNLQRKYPFISGRSGTCP